MSNQLECEVIHPLIRNLIQPLMNPPPTPDDMNFEFQDGVNFDFQDDENFDFN